MATPIGAASIASTGAVSSNFHLETKQKQLFGISVI